MARACFSACLICSFAIPVLLFNPSQLQVYPKDSRVSGVFEVAFGSLPNKVSYAFNASQAREVCQFLNVTIASKAQVLEAHRNGLETCRYGWIDEQIAVIPRIKPSQGCGQNQVGVIPWRTPVTKLFDVFCFNATDLEMQPNVTTTNVPTTTKKVLTASSTPSPTVTLLLQSTHSTQSSSDSPSPTPAHPDLSLRPQLKSITEFSFGVVPTALLVTAVMLLLLSAFAALWINRKSSIPFWKRKQKKEGDEEVWKSSCEKELNEHQTEDVEAGSKNNSS
ncbi:lymphatic vessel endothelial hyaluronic acid receptor 1-like [Megalops cyprinoides]|uniref:lymphatic vessel endothelial hyaluronic acid receptor 1-like n=1 Tax=Megalops cyprinoides TaxID=118141 RepID=UPI001863C371|nr:lymphatic vessel endothelial hyaluronic acid receptor 1-like [Megalops cyprinoides]